MKRIFSLAFFLSLSAGFCEAVPAGTAAAVFDEQDVPLDIDTLAESGHPQSPRQIQKRIKQLIGRTHKKWCMEAGIDFPPSCVLLRTFKLEKECELWAGSGSGPLKLVKVLRVCSIDDVPGPKTVIGDFKTPEGFYAGKELYGSRYWWMWMKLTPQEIDDPGEVGNGSSFKLCLNYPNEADIFRTSRLTGRRPGGGICMHGNCVTEGCVSFRNRVFLMVYCFAAMHDEKKNGRMQVHIFPFRFSEELKKQYSGSYAAIKRNDLLVFWNNIEEGYLQFEKTRRPLRFSCRKDRYVFGKE